MNPNPEPKHAQYSTVAAACVGVLQNIPRATSNRKDPPGYPPRFCRSSFPKVPGCTANAATGRTAVFSFSSSFRFTDAPFEPVPRCLNRSLSCHAWSMFASLDCAYELVTSYPRGSSSCVKSIPRLGPVLPETKHAVNRFAHTCINKKKLIAHVHK